MAGEKRRIRDAKFGGECIEVGWCVLYNSGLRANEDTGEWVGRESWVMGDEMRCDLQLICLFFPVFSLFLFISQHQNGKILTFLP